MADTENSGSKANEESEDVEIYKQLRMEEEEESRVLDPDKYDLSIYPTDIRLQDYKRDWDDMSFIIPAFQRNYVWKPAQASRFIESFLLGLPVPPVFLYKDKENRNYLIVDGQQRIISIVSFLSDEFVAGERKGRKFYLKGVSKKWEGKLFSELDKDSQFDIKSAMMRAIVIEQLQPKDKKNSIYAIFERLNTGGTPLNAMEVRMCVSEGEFSQLLKSLSKTDNWRKFLDREENMRGRELETMLRFFALHERWEDYKTPMKGFLNDYMYDNKEQSDEWIKKKRQLFEKTIEKILLMNSESVGRIRNNISIFSSVLVALADSEISDTELLQKFYDNLISNDDYLEIVEERGGTTNPHTVKRSIEIAKEVLANV